MDDRIRVVKVIDARLLYGETMIARSALTRYQRDGLARPVSQVMGRCRLPKLMLSTQAQT